MTTLNFLEECKNLGKRGRVVLIEAGKEGERCGASRYDSKSSKAAVKTDRCSRWTMAYLRLDKGSCSERSAKLIDAECP